MMANLDKSWEGINVDELMTRLLGRRSYALNDADAAGLANFTITDSSLTGTTACADLDAAITTEDDAFTVDSVEVGDAADCDGGARHVHEQLTSIIVPGARFRVDHLTDSEMVFTATSDGPEGERVVDPPSIRLMAL